MGEDLPPAAETDRLERLWGGQFGDDYIERNSSFEGRGAFWHAQITATQCQSVLEVGCNIGGNLQWIAADLRPSDVYGVDVNEKALALLTQRVPGVNAVWSPARALPFRDGQFDLVFTMGVLIHQPEAALPLVMSEIVRCSRRYVLCGEYHAAATIEVPYRGQRNALFKRDYEGLFLHRFPTLEVRDSGFLGRNEGWDDVTWTLFEKG